MFYSLVYSNYIIYCLVFHHCLSCSISSRTSNCRIENCRVIDSSSSSSSNSSNSNNCNSGSCLPVIISVRGLPCLLSSSQLLTLSFTGCLLPCLLKHVGYWWHRKSMSGNWQCENLLACFYFYLFFFLSSSSFCMLYRIIRRVKNCSPPYSPFSLSIQIVLPLFE